MEFFAGVNQWGWILRDLNNNVLGNANYPYGEFASQFIQLAALWSTYRLDALSVEFVPNNQGAG